MSGGSPAGPSREETVDHEPLEVLVDLLCEVETSLSREKVREVTAQVVHGRARQRRIALELMASPQVLRTGLSPCAIRVGTLLMMLKRAGAEQLAHPKCRVCGSELVTYLHRRARDWGCGPCLKKPETCASCGDVRAVRTRDRHGRPHCERCQSRDSDPTEALVAVLAGLEPALNRAQVLAALEQTARSYARRRQVAWAVVDRPDLLTGQGASAPVPGVLRFIDALALAGARAVIMPPCPRCGNQCPLKEPVDGQRLCASCVQMSRAVPCDRCGKTKPKNHRDECLFLISAQWHDVCRAAHW
ncbi:hypothetical protein [Streptomyces litchfieldiae]|uniref:Uncharacterized protein n=1 Tax=Streptomyces litchfieldiae TaxID=3075543 RepID=A0ABU2N0U3_9ACTN|nr:hypothetical protein [Streptomyces sp. DSM 44938]MDT0347525.1 hypothetical protein [Streptomyces sp. DSM 44938]